MKAQNEDRHRREFQSNDIDPCISFDFKYMFRCQMSCPYISTSNEAPGYFYAGTHCDRRLAT